LKGFDKFAEAASTFVSKAPFFSFCLAIVVGWLIGLPFAGPSNQLYHLVLNSPTTAITFLLVALLENSTHRFEKTTNQKLNALANAMADLMDEFEGMETDQRELRDAVGLEERMGT